MLLRHTDIYNHTPVVGWTKNSQKPKFYEKWKKSPKTQKRKNSKTSRDMPKLAIYPSTRGLSFIGKRGFQHVLYGKISKNQTTSEEKCLNLRPLLYITFPQGFRISKILDIQLREVGAKRDLNGPSKVN